MRSEGDIDVGDAHYDNRKEYDFTTQSCIQGLGVHNPHKRLPPLLHMKDVILGRYHSCNI